MLQWMGGSRRKLRASAKSLKARQQQFFELRRQEQRERGKVANGVAAAGNVAEEGPRHRSLDILGLEELRCGAPSAHEPQTVPGADQAHRSGQASTSLRKQEETARSPQAIVKTTTESKHTQQENDKPGKYTSFVTASGCAGNSK
ncbi:hypothetical protein R1sor_013924 [Riccia sorocarpa]|uniref:Uncharacterized protein n=1 Tax=Riccia sorocarpa TaxID=122646 RepID=A0ABD3H7Z0_9MARC